MEISCKIQAPADLPPLNNPIAVLWLMFDSVGNKVGLDNDFGESQSAICCYSSRSLVTNLSYFGS
jgi:hypothetical protein